MIECDSSGLCDQCPVPYTVASGSGIRVGSVNQHVYDLALGPARPAATPLNRTVVMEGFRSAKTKTEALLEVCGGDDGAGMEERERGGREIDRQVGRQADRRTDRQTDRHTGRQTERQAVRERGRERGMEGE